MAKAQIVSYGVCEVTGEDVGLEGVHVHVDSHRPLRADPPHGGRGGLSVLIAVSAPRMRNE